MNWWHLLTAGSGSLILHLGLGGIAIVILIALEIFTQELGVIPVVGPLLVTLLTPLRKDLLWAAGTIAIAMIVYSVGVHDANKRCTAKAAYVQTTVDKAVTRAGTPASRGLRDKFDSDH